MVVDRQEIRVLESQMVYGMEKWGHEKQLEEPINKYNFNLTIKSPVL